MGISARDEAIKTLLRIFAKSDFKHDFGEKVPSRDWITYSDRTRFAEMVQKFPVKERVAMLNKFDIMFKGKDGNNLLNILQGGIATQLYPEPTGDAGEFVTEEDVLLKIGVNYVRIKDDIKTHFSAPGQASPFKKDYVVTRAGIFSRNYTVGAQFYKNNDASKSTRNLASLFKDATGGATKFAILVDASLGMSVSAIGNSTFTPDPGTPCSFVVLQNVESDGDSATGVSDFEIKSGGANPTTVKIMRDVETSTVVYPIWNNPTDKRTEAENLFSKIQIILNRIEAGEIEASIVLGDESHNIPDVATTSNVKNASLNGLAAWFAKEILKEAATKGDQRKPYIYALLKRMGDWCQALSLLDRIRTYTALDPKTKRPIPGEKTATLQDLITQGYEVGLVTNDRILLAYGLLLGLNIYFTTASDMNCLVYFKNKDDIADEAALATNATRNYLEFQKLVTGEVSEMAIEPSTLKQRIAAKILEAKKDYDMVIPTSPTYKPFVDGLSETLKQSLVTRGVPAASGIVQGVMEAFRTKVLLSNIGELRAEFNGTGEEIKKYIDIYSNAAASPKEKYAASMSLINLVNRLNVDRRHNQFVINRLKRGEFSGTFTAQQNVFVDLGIKMAAGGRISTADIMSRAKDVVLSCRDDIKQVLQKNIVTPAEIGAYIPELPKKGEGATRPNDRDISNFEALYGAFVTVRTDVPAVAVGGQQGGGVNPILFMAILQRQVFPYKSAKLETTVERLTKAGDTTSLALLDSLPAAQIGTFYRDDKSRPYSVIDRYLITKEDWNVLDRILESNTGTFNQEETYTVYRFALLYHDILYERFEHVVDQASVAGALEPGIVEQEDRELTEGSRIELIKLGVEAGLLRLFINRYANAFLSRDRLKHLSDIRTLAKTGTAEAGELSTPEGVFFSKEPSQAETALENVRSVIFSKCPLASIQTVPDPRETGANTLDTPVASIEALIEGPAPAAVGDPDDAELGGGSRLDSGGGLTSNADTSSSGNRVSPGGRRGLYAGLRKRSGSGGAPGVRE